MRSDIRERDRHNHDRIMVQLMMTTLLRFLLVSSASTVAFQASDPCSNIRHRKGVVVWKYSQDNESSMQNADEGAPADATDTAQHNNPKPESVVVACMDAMLKNDVPWMNHGLEICFDFSSDRCRASLGGSLDEFISYAANPSFGPMINAKNYDIVNVGPMIAGSTTRGSMQTVLVKVTPEKGGDRHFLWTLQQERRPPRQGLWLVHECIYVENAFALTE